MGTAVFLLPVLIFPPHKNAQNLGFGLPKGTVGRKSKGFGLPKGIVFA